MARSVACFVLSGLAFVSPLVCVCAYEQVRLSAHRLGVVPRGHLWGSICGEWIESKRDPGV